MLKPISSTQVFDHEVVADLLLYDINVELGLEYADPTRETFPFFQPFFRRNPDLPLRERMKAAYGSLDQESHGSVRAGIIEALKRCAMQWLGFWRSLEVFDLHQAVAPETLSNATAIRLLGLRNPADSNDRARWLDHLLRRWRDNGISPEIPSAAWIEVIRDVHIDALLPTVRYIATGPLKLDSDVVQCFEQAERRMSDHPSSDQVDQLAALDEIWREVVPGDISWLTTEKTAEYLSTQDSECLNELESLLVAKGVTIVDPSLAEQNECDYWEAEAV